MNRTIYNSSKSYPRIKTPFEKNALRKPIIYLNHWEYNNHQLVKLITKSDAKNLFSNATSYPWIRYSRQYGCFYFIKSDENLQLFYSIFSTKAVINDWYLNRQIPETLINAATLTNKSLNLELGLCRRLKKPQIRLLPIKTNQYPNHIILKFNNNKTLYSALKKIDCIKWSKTLYSFIIGNDTNLIQKLILKLKGIAFISVSKELVVKDAQTILLLLNQSYQDSQVNPFPIAYIEKLVALNYSKNTISSYYKHFLVFLNFNKNKDIEKLEKEDIETYIRILNESKPVSSQYIHMSINAIKFYYEKVLGKDKFSYSITRPKKGFSLPNVMSEQEVQKLLNAPENLKHKCILLLIYSAGLRRSELINIKISDIQKDRDLIFIRGAKGKKDRYSILSNNIRSVLRRYYLKYKPKEWLFEGQYGSRYSTGSIQKIFNSAKQKAGIQRKVTPHSLRHSFASHLIERGTDISIVQGLLGHNSIKTTQIYTHVVMKKIEKIKSPLDNLILT